MRNTMHKKDLRKADGFPYDIDRSKLVVVIVASVTHVAYYNKDGELCLREVGDYTNQRFADGIYVLK